MRLRDFSYRAALVVSALAFVGACSDPTSSGDDGDGNGNGSEVQEGSGRAEITGAESLTLEGDATWTYTTDISSRGTRYAQFNVAVAGDDQDEALESRLFQAYDPETENRPDSPEDGTYQLGSSMDDNTVRFTNAGGTTYYFDGPSTGDLTLTKDGTVWTLELDVTGLDDFDGNLVDVTATVKAVPEP